MVGILFGCVVKTRLREHGLTFFKANGANLRPVIYSVVRSAKIEAPAERFPKFLIKGHMHQLARSVQQNLMMFKVRMTH